MRQALIRVCSSVYCIVSLLLLLLLFVSAPLAPMVPNETPPEIETADTLVNVTIWPANDTNGPIRYVTTSAGCCDVVMLMFDRSIHTHIYIWFYTYICISL